jgi:putative membrane-bound dehydrogenase-like protein
MRALAASLLITVTAVAAAPDPNAPAPLPPDKAVAAMQLPEGFRVRLCTGEPELVKPIAMTLDERGRLWVVESHSYPKWITDGGTGKDRILIFEDRKGEGRFDSCTVFMDNGTNLSGIAIGFGGVWLCATPNLLFIPVKRGEDKPAGPPVVILDGWTMKPSHNVFNTLVWGPDGWLYGCNGIIATSRIGVPGTPEEQRAYLNCGVWRYHPVKKKVEVFAWGSTNPWGLDFDDYGEMFITNCVIKHIFHVVPGAHYVRMYGQDVVPNTYGLIESCADHIHWAGGDWTSSRGGVGAHSEHGGGHAHTGAMVYLGDNWPAEYRSRVYMCNIHGNRINEDLLERKGSGYVIKHGKDFLFANDSWFRGLIVQLAPDGGVYVADWCDTGECHNYKEVHPRGRIYKVTYGNAEGSKTRGTDVARLDDAKLVELQLHKNDWWVRQARRFLQERAAAGKLGKDVPGSLRKMFDDQTDVTRKLRALWALHVIAALDEKQYLALLDHREEAIRVWAVRLALEDRKASDPLAVKLTQMAAKDPAAPVRLALASGLQRLPVAQRWPIAEALAAHAEDASDINLPLMIWYGLEPAVAADSDRATALAGAAKIPLVREYIARRVAQSGVLTPLVRALSTSSDVAIQSDILAGMHRALAGQRLSQPPEGWNDARRKLMASASAEVRQRTLVLSGVFADPAALASLKEYAGNAKEADDLRQTALQTLIEVKAAGVGDLLRTLLTDAKMRGAAIRGLAAVNDPQTPELILALYDKLGEAEKRDAVTTLASRPAFAMALLEAVEKNRVPRKDISVFTARQIVNLKDKKLTAKLNSAWGTINTTAKSDKTKLMAKYRAMIPPAALAKADRAQGKALFTKTCATCHTLFNEGSKVAPDLTGSQRANPDYLLSKLVDPNFAVSRDFQMWVIETRSGRIISGLITQETEKTITVQTQNEAINLAKSDIESRTRTNQSLMPEGILDHMTEAEVRNLIGYVAGAGPVK